MSQKHNQRTRAEILAKREQEIPSKRLNRNRSGLAVSTPHAMVLKASRGKYTPHFGAKQQAKLQKAALKLAV